MENISHNLSLTPYTKIYLRYTCKLKPETSGKARKSVSSGCGVGQGVGGQGVGRRSAAGPGMAGCS